MADLRPFGPKTASHPSCGADCRACGHPMEAGSYTTLIPLGPGDDHEARLRAAVGRPYNAVAVEVHWSCATGLDDDVAAKWLEHLKGER